MKDKSFLLWNSNFVKDKSLINDIVEKYRGKPPIVYGINRSGSTLLRKRTGTMGV